MKPRPPRERSGWDRRDWQNDQEGDEPGLSGQQGVAGPQGLKGDAGETGPQGPKGDTGDQGAPGAVQVISISTRTPTIDVAFQPSATKITSCRYPTNIVVTAAVLAGQTATINMLSDASNPPTTIVDKVTRTIGSGLVLGLTFEDYIGAVVPAGHYVMITTSGSAGATKTVGQGIEQQWN